MTRNLSGIKTTLDEITGQDEHLQRHLDAETISIIEGTCPKLFTQDRLLLDKKKHLLFRDFPGGGKQNAIDRIYAVGHIIPSLHTFFEDTKLLESCAKIMKKLLPGVCRTSLHQELNQLHNGQRSWIVQRGENKFIHRDEESSDVVQHNAYRQLWLYAIRHFPEMICQPLRKDPSGPKPPTPGLELVWWYNFTKLAIDCGYTGVNQTYSRSEEADAKMLEIFMERVRPSQLWPYDKTHDTGTIKNILSQLSRRRDPGKSTADSTNLGDYKGIECGPDIATRCGVPFESAFRSDQKALFLPCIDRTTSADSFLGSFAVKRHTFQGFFGAPSTQREADARSLPEDPTVPTPTQNPVTSSGVPPPLTQTSGVDPAIPPSVLTSPVNNAVPPSDTHEPEPEPAPAESSCLLEPSLSPEHAQDMDDFSSTAPPDLSTAQAGNAPNFVPGLITWTLGNTYKIAHRLH